MSVLEFFPAGLFCQCMCVFDCIMCMHKHMTVCTHEWWSRHKCALAYVGVLGQHSEEHDYRHMKPFSGLNPGPHVYVKRVLLTNKSLNPCYRMCSKIVLHYNSVWNTFVKYFLRQLLNQAILLPFIKWADGKHCELFNFMVCVFKCFHLISKWGKVKPFTLISVWLMVFDLSFRANFTIALKNYFYFLSVWWRKQNNLAGSVSNKYNSAFYIKIWNKETSPSKLSRDDCNSCIIWTTHEQFSHGAFFNFIAY